MLFKKSSECFTLYIRMGGMEKIKRHAQIRDDEGKSQNRASTLQNSTTNVFIFSFFFSYLSSREFSGDERSFPHQFRFSFHDPRHLQQYTPPPDFLHLIFPASPLQPIFYPPQTLPLLPFIVAVSLLIVVPHRRRREILLHDDDVFCGEKTRPFRPSRSVTTAAPSRRK